MANVDPRILAKIEEMHLEEEASKRASADPLPGPLAKAFGPLNIAVDEYAIRPIVAYDWAIMKILNSPIYRQMLEFMQDGEKAALLEVQPHEQWELIYLLTRPCEEADKVFSKGAGEFSNAAKREFAFSTHPLKINKLFAACMEQLKNHMATMVKYAQEQEDDGAKDSPLSPLSSAGKPPATDSGGGSTT